MLKAVIFDFGHTIIDELKDSDIPLKQRPISLMPGLPDTLSQINLDMGIWANTRQVREPGVRLWLRRAGINSYFRWVVTSADAGVRKPEAQFFSYALRKCGMKSKEILFVGNQLNTDIKGANDYGIRCVWLSGVAYRSPDDDPAFLGRVKPTHVVESLKQLPSLVKSLGSAVD